MTKLYDLQLVESAAWEYLDLWSCRHNYCDLFPPDQPWILRNLTTKQIAHAEAIAIKPEFIHGPHIEGLGFGHVVLSRISWSSTMQTMHWGSMREQVTNGGWVGHRFDITTVARHLKETNDGSGWTDASDEVAKQVANELARCLGPQWREIVVKRH